MTVSVENQLLDFQYTRLVIFILVITYLELKIGSHNIQLSDVCPV